jgi:hypothetical protein
MLGKDAVVAYSIHPRICLRRTRITIKDLFRLAGVLAEIGTKHLLKRNIERYLYTNLFNPVVT